MSKASQERLKAVVQVFVAVATSGGKIRNFYFSKEMADAGFLATFRPSLSTHTVTGELNPTRDAQIDPLVLYWVVHRPSGSGITLMLKIFSTPLTGLSCI